MNITRIRDNNTRIVLLSLEYGKITAWWSKKNISGIDLGDIVEVLLSRENTKNTIKTIDTLIPGWSKDWSYTRILSFMETLCMIKKISLDGHECHALYIDVYLFIEYGIRYNITPSQYAIFQMRILKTLGSMNKEILGDDPILNYIYDNISHTPLERILAANTIKIDQIKKIQQVNLHSIYMLAQ